MQIILHAGAHFTEEDRLYRTLLRNREAFATRGVRVPEHETFRQPLRTTLDALNNRDVPPETRDILLDLMTEDTTPDRLILSHLFLFSVPHFSVRDGMLYHSAPERLAKLKEILRFEQLELFFALRNPATLLPALFESSQHPTMIDFLGGHDPRQIAWSDTLRAIRTSAPDVPITVWCFEDLPLVWAEVIREMAGYDPGEKITGGFELLSHIMSREGMKRFRAYLKEHPNMSERQKRRVMSAFLDKFAIEDRLEEDLIAPGWTDDLIDKMTELYEEDVLACARIPGVHLISP